MAKYDDFGRPIYETAEEYNRAHKRGGSYLYNTVEEQPKQRTATQRHAMRAGSRKAKKLIVSLIAFVVAIWIGIVLVVFHTVGGFSGVAYEYNVEDWLQFENDNGYEEYIGGKSTPLPEGFETFIYNGESIALPTTFDEFSSMNFVIDTEYDEDDCVPSEFGEFIDLADADGNVFAMISVDNYTEDEIPLGKCTIDYFSISNPYIYDDSEEVLDFVFGDGLTFESTYEEVEAYLGVPYYHYEDHSEEGFYYDSYEWTYYGDYETHYVSITFMNEEILDISIQKSVDEQEMY